MSISRFFALALVGVASVPLHAGEYSLAVDDRVAHECEREASASRNTCASGIVVTDLKAHFLSGNPFRLASLAASLPAGRLSFSSSTERGVICGTLAELLASEQLRSPEALERAVIATNYVAMYDALVKVRSWSHLSSAAEARLDRALAGHPRRKR